MEPQDGGGMNHADVVTETPRALPRRRTGTWVLSHGQMGLLFGCVGIGLILAFGAGFIVGMWYPASEHMPLFPERPAVVADLPPPPPASPPSSPPESHLTFYSTLAKSGTPSNPAAAAGGDRSAARAFAGPGSASALSKGGERSGESSGVNQSVAVKTAAVPKAAERLPEVASTPQGAVGKTPTAPKGNARATEQESSGASAAAKALPPAAGYSVQVGSFRSREQAESLLNRLTQKGYRVAIRPTTLPGKGIWYRVQVGGFTERGAADRLAQQLASQERMTGVIIDTLR